MAFDKPERLLGRIHDSPHSKRHDYAPFTRASFDRPCFRKLEPGNANTEARIDAAAILQCAAKNPELASLSA
jgi:hypothetical protein